MKVIKNSTCHLHVKSEQKTHWINVSNILKVSNKDTGMESGTSIVNFQHVSHFILLSNLLNLNKEMLVGPEKWTFETINLFLVTVRNILFYGLGKFVRLYVLRMRKDKLSQRHKDKWNSGIFASTLLWLGIAKQINLFGICCCCICLKIWLLYINRYFKEKEDLKM